MVREAARGRTTPALIATPALCDTPHEMERVLAATLLVAFAGHAAIGCSPAHAGATQTTAQRLPRAVAVARSAPGPSGAEPIALVEADLAREAQREPFAALPDGASLRVQCCVVTGLASNPASAP